MVRERLSRRRRFQSDAGGVADIHRADRGQLQYVIAVDGIDAQFQIAPSARLRRQPDHGIGDRPLPVGRLPVAAPHAAFGRRRGTDGRGRRDGVSAARSGRGLTGFSTLALTSFVAVAGIMAGTALGLRGALRVRPLAAA
jgi:hypothetical protein